MQGRRFHPITPDRRQLDAGELERLAQHVEALDQLTIGGAGQYVDTGSGRVLIPAGTTSAIVGCTITGRNADGFHYDGFILESYDVAGRRFLTKTAAVFVDLAEVGVP